MGKGPAGDVVGGPERKGQGPYVGKSLGNGNPGRTTQLHRIGSIALRVDSIGPNEVAVSGKGGGNATQETESRRAAETAR